MYLETLKLSFNQNSIYSANIILTIIGSIISVVVQMSLWAVLMQNGVLESNVSLNNMIQFTIINSIIATLTSANIESVIAQKVRDGSIGIDFIRPINLKFFLFSDAIGNNLFKLLFCSAPVCIFAIVFYEFSLPATPIMFSVFLVALALGLAISFEISYIFAMLAFWMETVWFISWYTRALYTLLGGSFIPVWFYPPFLVNISKVFPFYYVAFAQISIYTGKETLQSSIKILLTQGVWLLVLWGLEKVIWWRAQKMIMVTGG